jgi:hypothetical protein
MLPSLLSLTSTVGSVTTSVTDVLNGNAVNLSVL